MLRWDPRPVADAIEARLRLAHEDWLGDAFWLVRARVLQARGAGAIAEIVRTDPTHVPDDALASPAVGFASPALWAPQECGGLQLEVRAEPRHPADERGKERVAGLVGGARREETRQLYRQGM